MPLTVQVGQSLPDEGFARVLADVAGDVDVLGGRRAHQAGGEVHGIAEAHEGPPHLVAVRAASEAAVGDADLQVARRGRLREVAQVQGRRRRPRRVVLVGERRPEDAVQVGALVAERQLQDVAAVPVEDALRRPDELVELLDRVVVVVVVDAAEAHEHGDRRPELREELASAGLHPLVHRGQEPRPDELLGQGGRLAHRLAFDLGQEAAEHPVWRVRLPVSTQLGQLDAIAQRLDRRGVEHDLALLGVVLGGGEVVHQPAGQHVDQLDVGIADDEASGVADSDRHLHPELDRAAARRHDRAGPPDRPLHALGRRARPRAVVAVDPAGDGVAREVDDVAVIRVELVDDGVEDAPDVGRQLLGATLRAELLGERLGQGREAADVGEHRGAVDPVGHRTPGPERRATITRDVGVWPVAGNIPRRRRPGSRTRHRAAHRPCIVRGASTTRAERPGYVAEPDVRRFGSDFQTRYE